MSDRLLRPTSQNVAYWLGWGLSGLAIAFCLMDAIMKLLALPFVLEASDRIGFHGETVIRELGMILLGCTILYAIPATAVLGAVLRAEPWRRTCALVIRCSRTSYRVSMEGYSSGEASTCVIRGCERSSPGRGWRNLSSRDLFGFTRTACWDRTTNSVL